MAYTLKIVIEGEDRASGAIKGVGSALGDIGKIAAGVSLGNLFSGAVQSLTGMTGAALQSYASYERLSQSIGAMAAKEALLTGAASNMSQALAMTKEQSKETLDWISKLAIQSPFKQSDVAQAFRLAQALGFNTQEAKRLTQATLDWATATGAQGYDIERVNRALGQMQVKGKVSQEEINQLTEAGVDAQRILSGAFGKSGTDLQKAFQNGSITSREAIDAIIKDMERLYQGAGANSASSMTGLLSTLEEIQDIAGRNLFGGMFEAAKPYIAETVGVLTAPEFQAGLTDLGLKLGGGLTAGLDGIVQKAGEVIAALKPLLDAQAPAWMVALQGLATATGSEFKISVKPEIAQVTWPEGGLKKLEVAASATSIEAADGAFLKIDTLAKSVTMAAGANLPTFEFKANVTPEAQAIIDKLLGAGAEGGAKGFGYELGVQTRLELLREMSSLAEKLPKMDWESYKQEWQKTFDTWQPAIKGLSEVGPRLSAAIQSAMSTPISIVGKWWENGPGTLFAELQTPFKEPIMLAGSWGNNTVTTLWNGIQDWFTANPVNLTVNTTYDRNPGLTPRGVAPGTKYPTDVTPPIPEQYVDPVTGEVKTRATGDGFFYGGWTMVGEKGPELVNLPRGARIYNNSDTKRMMMPGFAEGTTSAGAFGDALRGLLSSLGLYKTQTAGPPTREEAGFWRDFTDHSKQAAAQAGNAFVDAAQDAKKAWEGAFESALGNVPGLFGASQVTEQDMTLAKYGAYKPKADEYLRQLSDEVLNGKEHGDKVDIKDAAKRAGIDPNLPNEIVLDLVKQAWADGSFFSNKANLDLINTDAVKSSLEQQQKEAQGKANIMSMFGLTDESSQQTADQLGAALNTVFGKAAESDALNTSGAAIFNKLIAGASDPATAATGMGKVASSMAAASALPENAAILYDAGKADARTYYSGWHDFAAGVTPTPPGGAAVGPPTNPNATPPAHNALGSPHWRGGWTVAGEYGPELLDLPGGTRIYDAPTTARMRGDAQPVTVNQTFVVNSELLVEMAAQRTVQLIRRRGH